MKVKLLLGMSLLFFKKLYCSNIDTAMMDPINNVKFVTHHFVCIQQSIK